MNFKRYHVSRNLFDGTTTITGFPINGAISSSAQTRIAYCPCNANTTYTVSKKASQRFNVFYTVDEPAAGVSYYGLLADNTGTSITITTGNDAKYLCLFYYNSNYDTDTEEEIRNTLMFNTGSQPLPYEPYSSEVWHDTPHYVHNTSTDTITTPADIYANAETATVGLKGDMSQSSTPSPSSPIQPSECGERTAQLFDVDSEKTIVSKIAYDCPLTIGQLYTFTNCTDHVLGFKISNAPNGANSIQVVSIQPHESSRFTMTRNSSIPEGTTQYFFIIMNSVYGVKVNDGDIMVNAGTTPVPYEPYGYKIPILNNSQTTNVYLGEVESTRRIKKLVFDGTESSWIVAGTGDAQCFRLDITGYLYDTINICYCTHYESQQNITRVADVIDNHCAFYANPNNIYYSFNIKDTTYATVEDFKTYLQQQYAAGTPVTVWYVLATPETAVVNEPIRKIGTYADEVSGITIPTIAGANAVDVLTTLKPSEVTATYKGWHPVEDVHERESGAWT